MKYTFWILYFLIGILLAIVLSPLTVHSDAPPRDSHVLYEQTIVRANRGKIDDAVVRYCPLNHRGVAFIIIQAESNFNQYAVGDHGTSFGLVQIHLPAHPNITRTQAEDVDFSIKFLCDNLVKGNQKMWSTNPIRGS